MRCGIVEAGAFPVMSCSFPSSGIDFATWTAWEKDRNYLVETTWWCMRKEPGWPSLRICAILRRETYNKMTNQEGQKQHASSLQALEFGYHAQQRHRPLRTRWFSSHNSWVNILLSSDPNKHSLTALSLSQYAVLYYCACIPMSESSCRRHSGTTDVCRARSVACRHECTVSTIHVLMATY